MLLYSLFYIIIQSIEHNYNCDLKMALEEKSSVCCEGSEYIHCTKVYGHPILFTVYPKPHREACGGIRKRFNR